MSICMYTRGSARSKLLASPIYKYIYIYPGIYIKYGREFLIFQKSFPFFQDLESFLNLFGQI